MVTLVKFFHRLLLLCPAELAHNIGIAALKVYQMVWCRFVPRVEKAPVMAIGKVRSPFKPVARVGLAAGFDKNAEVFAGLSTFGFGFIEIGTVTPLPQSGNPKPRLWRMPDEALVNHLGFNSVGVDAVKRNILRLRKYSACPLLGNIGKNRNTPLEEALEDYKSLFETLQDCVDGFVINLSSPNTPGLKSLQNEDFLTQLAQHIPELPTLVKFSPDLANTDIQRLSQFVKDEPRFTGVVLTNTSRTLAEKAGMDIGGLSGKPLFERSLECVQLARQSVGKKTVIGVGGISSVVEAKKMFDAGADLIEVYTAFIYQGPSLISELNA